MRWIVNRSLSVWYWMERIFANPLDIFDPFEAWSWARHQAALEMIGEYPEPPTRRKDAQD